MISPLPLQHPATAQRLPLRLQRRPVTRLSDIPALATAASATTAGLDTEGDTFAAVSACLETLARLNLGVTSTRLLLILAKNGPLRCKELGIELATSYANLSQFLGRLVALGLIATGPGQDGREVKVSLTDAGRKVLASIVALTANCLKQAAGRSARAPLQPKSRN